MRKTAGTRPPPPTRKQIADAKAHAMRLAIEHRHDPDALWHEVPWGSRFYLGEPKREGEHPRSFATECRKCEGLLIVRQGEDGAMVIEGAAMTPCSKSR